MSGDESQTAKAIKIMKEYDPDFTMEELENDAKGCIYNI